MRLLIIASAFWDEKGNIGLEKKNESQSHVIDVQGTLWQMRLHHINERITT